MIAIWDSGVFEAVSEAEHPSPDAGGPCATCAFRPGSEASQTAHTVSIAKLCVEGIVPFHCHEKPQLCRGFIAAANARWADNPDFNSEREQRHREACRFVAERLGEAIGMAREVDEAISNERAAKGHGEAA